MIVLALDTSASNCAAGIYDGAQGRLLARQESNIGRGHAELLMDQIDLCLKDSSLSYKDISRVSVVRGPGSFTGLRVGLSVAKGLALSLAVRAVGISALDCLAHEADVEILGDQLLTVVEARRDQVYAQLGSASLSLLPIDEFHEWRSDTVRVLCGSAARAVAAQTEDDFEIAHEAGFPAIETVALLGSRLTSVDKPLEPLYLRGADAKIQRGFAIERQSS